MENKATLAAKRARHAAELQKLHESRQKQFADNDARYKDLKRQDRELFVRVMQEQKEKELEERQQMAQRRQAFLRYKSELNTQMKKNDEVRQNDKHAMIIEGKKNRLMIDQERNRIQMIKAQKLASVRQLGVQERYTAELENKKTTF